MSAVHATVVVIGETGVLIRGPAGAGKSSLALALVEAAMRRGWFGRLVGDDRVDLAAYGGRVVARGHPALRGRIERRGEGLLDVPWEAAARLGLVVDLRPPDELPRLPEAAAGVCTVEEVVLPRLLLPARDGRPDTPGRVLDILTATGKN